MPQLRGKVALVTGAGSGIGRAAASLLAREGARVAALGRTRGELESTVAEMEAAGGEGLAIRADIADVAQIRGAIEQMVARWGRLDIVVANAGINGVWAPL